MEELLAYLARSLVDDPEAVDVESFEEDDGTIVLELHVAPDDTGKVIGRGGRTVAALRGEALVIEAALAEDEWLAGDLVGCSVPGLGSVSRVVEGPTCSMLELEDGTLVPLVGDAVSRVDPEAGVIEVDREFLGR